MSAKGDHIPTTINAENINIAKIVAIGIFLLFDVTLPPSVNIYLHLLYIINLYLYILLYHLFDKTTDFSILKF